MNVLRFLGWMQKRGWEVILYGRPDTRMFVEARRRGLPVRRVYSTLRTGDLVNAWRLARHLRRDGVRRLVVHQSQDYFVGAFARRFSSGFTRLLSSQHMHIGGTKKDVFHSWLYRQFDAWATPVQWLADRVMEKTVVPPEKIHVIPRGIEIERFTANRPGRAEARAHYGLSEDDFVIGLIGRLDPKKCQDVAVKALAAVHASGHRAHLLLVGDQSFNEGDDYAASVHRKVDELGLGEQVHFHPHDKFVERAYAALDIFTMASRSECYGMVTIEAMVSGIPVIGTNDGGTVSLIDHERNGLLVEPRDVDGLAQALLRLIERPDLRDRLRREAQDEAVVKYSHLRQCEAWEALFRSFED
ncbi:MAG: glycosyltransferase family 4 protein [bacterium]|nr:glycosyltransferase family 4 protein [bacterium]